MKKSLYICLLMGMLFVMAPFSAPIQAQCAQILRRANADKSSVAAIHVDNRTCCRQQLDN